MATTAPAPPLFAHLGDPWRLAEMLDLPGVLCTGHFRLLSGQHSDRFVRFSELARRPEALAYIAQMLAESIAPLVPEGVVAPCTAGVALGSEIARRLGVRLYLASVDDAGRAVSFIGTPPQAETPLVVVNDVVTTGQGLRALADVVADAQARLIAGAAFLCRSESVIDVLEVPLSLVATVPMPSWALDCPLCAANESLADGRDLN